MLDAGVPGEAEGSARPVPAVILAGGLARRMGGGDKALRSLGGRPVLDHVIDQLSAQAHPIALNANGDPGRFARYGLTVIADPVPDRPGPLAGVLAALDWASGIGAGRVVTVAADTPFFPSDLVEALADAADRENVPIALAATREGGRIVRHPTFGLWSVSLRTPLAQALAEGTRKVVAFTDPHGAATALFETQEDPFFNVNTPEDLARAETMLAGV